MNQPDQRQATSQPDPHSSSDGDGSWTEDPITQDPHQDRSVEHVIEQTQKHADDESSERG